jgi:hypothetical protein
VQLPHSRFDERVEELPTKASPRPALHRLICAIAFAAALPLVVGAWPIYGADADAALGTLLAPAIDFTKFEDGEAKPGGGATSRASTDTPNAFSASSGNMDFKRELDFKVGNGIFRKNWVSAPSSTDSSDGLGPLFNARACQNCHLKDGRGHPPLSSDVPDDSGSMLVRLSVPPATDADRALLEAHKMNSLPDPTYGGQLQDFAIQGFASEGKLKIAYKERKVKLAGGETVSLRVPTYSLADLNYGPASPDIMISPRVAPQMIGLGLLEAVPEAQILDNADPDDANKDGIRGKPNMVWSQECVARGQIGRHQQRTERRLSNEIDGQARHRRSDQGQGRFAGPRSPCRHAGGQGRGRNRRAAGQRASADRGHRLRRKAAEGVANRDRVRRGTRHQRQRMASRGSAGEVPHLAGGCGDPEKARPRSGVKTCTAWRRGLPLPARREA